MEVSLDSHHGFTIPNPDASEEPIAVNTVDEIAATGDIPQYSREKAKPNAAQNSDVKRIAIK
jgi:hypothetical protein